MNTLFITVGLPQSGKTTWARMVTKKIGAPIVNPDSIRLALHGQAFILEAEDFVWAIARVMVKSLFKAGHEDVIVDATNITRKRRNFWQSDFWETIFIPFNCPVEVCIKRAKESGRLDLIPVIERMAATFESIQADEKSCDGSIL